MRRLVLIALLSLASPGVFAQGTANAAFDAAIAAFETALPRLEREVFGVDVATYRDALSFRRFTSAYWGGEITLAVTSPSSADGACGRFAAYVGIPPDNGVVSLVLCPQFRNEGSDQLRRLTILHEMVHVVAGPDECRAMAFAARIESLATGSYTPVEAYWQANNCPGSAFSLP